MTMSFSADVCYHGFVDSKEHFDAAFQERYTEWQKYSKNILQKKEGLSLNTFFEDANEFMMFWLDPNRIHLVDNDLIKAIKFSAVEMLLEGADFKRVREVVFRALALKMRACRLGLLKGEDPDSDRAKCKTAKCLRHGVKTIFETKSYSGLVHWLTKDMSCSCASHIKSQFMEANNDGPPLSCCAACGVVKPKMELFRCSRCKFMNYCSRDCQVKDWKEHKGGCAIFSCEHSLFELE
jgi:hypothetical protein